MREVQPKAFSVCEKLKDVRLNEGLKIIGSSAFRDCPSLEVIRFPSAVREVQPAVFSYCKNLKEVIFNEGLRTIGWGAFGSCASLEIINFPSTMRKVGPEAFRECGALKEVVLNEGLERIGKRSFYECQSLEAVELPSTLSNIGIEAFARCSALRDVVLGEEGLRLIGWKAFRHCGSLKGFRYPYVSKRLEGIRFEDRPDIAENFNKVPGVRMAGCQVTISTAIATGGHKDRTAREERLESIRALTAYYALKEATTILELALWKMTMEERGAGVDDRNACRIEVPGPVKVSILDFLQGGSGMR